MTPPRRSGRAQRVLPLPGTGAAAEGHFDNVSVAPGEQIGLHGRSVSPSIDVSLIPLGWYGGLGGRLMARWRNVLVARQPDPCRIPRPARSWPAGRRP